ncbi:redoxin domain-containing protein [Psychrobacillus sp. FSL K6-2684]|uniref:peroxiredoxin family protein n=1 Tax=unclassified Psychrobacillus TaxID=2636677 RepID=UPI0012445ECF|nr:redoxin domain-containing protein [Psychrobacillus sp. AK 1817]QEY21154.1 hypothetical protein D0S48_10865 [Psychrobacillus sp. AK 1817]
MQIIYIITCFLLLIIALSILKEVKFGEDLQAMFLKIANDSILHNGDVVSNFNLSNIDNTKVTLDDLTDKPLILLVIDTGCDVCDQDLSEFAEESLIYGEFYNFVPVVSKSPSSNKKIEIKNHFFKEILFTNSDFLKNYKISMYPTFILINSEHRFISYVKYARELKKYFDLPEIIEEKII